MSSSAAPYYRSDLALVHHLGFGMHADRCAPGVLALLEPVRRADGVVLELGCGSGRLTRHLVDAGHRVIATDASPAMLELAGREVPEAHDVRQLVLPDDELPSADAVVSVGHVLNYLPDETAAERALVALARALRPGGILAVDLCDVRWGAVRRGEPVRATVTEDWAVITRYAQPDPARHVRTITTFVRGDGGSWRRDDERHDNVLLHTSKVPRLLARHGVDAAVHPSIGDYDLPDGMVAVVGTRPRPS